MSRKEPPIADLFAAAVGHHRAGRLGEAEPLYRQILAVDPGHADSLHLLGLIAHRVGRYDAALNLIGQAIALNGQVAEYHNNIGEAFRATGKFDEAHAHYERALALKPGFAEAHFNLGNALGAQGKPSAAIARYEQALAIRPAYPEALSNLGLALRAQGRIGQAIERYEQALAIRPAYPEALNNLGNAFKDQGKLDAAILRYQQALGVKPDFPEALYNLGIALQEKGRLDEAIARYRQALGIKPSYPKALQSLGLALQAQGRLDQAAECYEQALAIKPDDLDALHSLGLVRRSQRQFDEAVACFERTLGIKPDFPEALSNLGMALLDLNRPEAAAARLEQALSLKPNFAEAHYNFAISQLALGRVAKARQHLETAIALDPRRPTFFRLLADTKEFTAGDPHLSAMQSLAQDISSLGEDDQTELHFALGKAYDDIGEGESSFRHLIAGNALKRRRAAYDERGTLERLKRAQTIFTRDFIEARQGMGDPSPAPIFILGMPRSGTSLIEQILASHPQIHGAGETDDFAQAVERFGMAGFSLPDAKRSRGALRKLGAHYVSGLRTLAPAAARIADKTLTNIRFAGLIHLTLPNARIVHVYRDPVDTCLSCFSKLFVGDAQLFSYDLAELGRYYRAYERLMDHWRDVLPDGTVLDVSYEAVVADLEGQARAIVAHCGLDWDASCLTFHETRRSVRTASAAQVRQPIYTGSVGRWQRYGQQLRPLLDALDLPSAPN